MGGWGGYVHDNASTQGALQLIYNPMNESHSYAIIRDAKAVAHYAIAPLIDTAARSPVKHAFTTVMQLRA